MTQREIDTLKKSLPHRFKDMTEEQIILYNELSWRDYCNSCITYGEEYYIVKNGVFVLNGRTRLTYLYCQGKEVITPQRAMEIFNEQVQSFREKAVISRGVYADSEGCSYNSVKWIDD
jgi:hypothetical protein